MRFSLLLLLLIYVPGMAPAQTQPPAPVERQTPAAALPNAPQPTPTQAEINAAAQWERLARQSHYLRPEIRIQAVGDPIRCDVDKVTSDEVFCTQHRANNGPLGSLFIPKETYHVPRREIRDIRIEGREMSTLLGAGIGMGVGVGLGSINNASRTDGAQAILGLLLGGLGGFVGHALPFAGHAVYQQP